MVDRRCYVVPPYLLQSISKSKHNAEPIRKAAEATLTRQVKINSSHHDRSRALTESAGVKKSSHSLTKPSIVPVDLLRYLANSEDVDEKTRKSAERDLAHLSRLHERVLATPQDTASSNRKGTAVAEDESKKDHTFYRAVYDAQNSFVEYKLPGKLVRAEGQPPAKDKAVNDAYDNVGRVLAMYKQLFNWTSVDNKNMHIISTVHFGDNYENAYWDPDRVQMVFGDGDEFLSNFTGCVDVIGHELTHAVTENTTPLLYFGQSGALNEHVSDVFGIMVKQIVEKEDAASADWLIGEGCIAPGVKGVALRSMKAPGTAYNDPRFGKDPQPDHFKYYEATFEDNGGVHIYSGIPNKAFYLCAKGFGGYSWEKAGKIWWITMTEAKLSPQCTFLEFANATIAAAKSTFGEEAAKIVQNAWGEVGVVQSAADDKTEDEDSGSWMDRIGDMCRPF